MALLFCVIIHIIIIIMSKLTSVVFVTKWVGRYVAATASYGFVRTVTYDYEKSTEYFNHNTRTFERKTPLLVDTIGRTASFTLAAVSIWPLMLGWDLARLECFVRERDVAEYGMKRR